MSDGKDLQGRPYAKISEVKEGTRLQVDGDFVCIAKDAIVTVQSGEGELFVECSAGGHDLAGQIQGDYYNGMYLV